MEVVWEEGGGAQNVIRVLEQLIGERQKQQLPRMRLCLCAGRLLQRFSTFSPKHWVDIWLLAS